ncbi:MAG: DUF427 domain-containing protein [Pelagimonas sp.]|jgi:uncharacterized protein (DUF427 family)|nr:DUF427 domain-containing protein [Pelagimonas sp.]
MTNHITIVPAQGNWVIRAGGAVLGESRNALELIEGDRDPVIYFPREDIGMAFLEATDHKTNCPHKGEASYFSIMSKSKTYENAVWSYDAPIDAVAQIKGYLAFEQQDGVAVEEV